MNNNINFISVESVLKIYRDLMSKYDSGGELRDYSLLDSAISGVKNFVYYHENTTIHDIAAAYCFYLCKNHAFSDGNKRISFFVMAYFLRAHNYKIVASHKKCENTIRSVAKGDMEIKDIAEWLKKNTGDIE